MVKDTNSKPEISPEAVKETTTATASAAQTRERKQYTVTFYSKWCKSCGLCSAFCVKEIIQTDKTGMPFIAEEDMKRCTGCRFCEIHCPDFAITIKERYPERRRSDVK